MFAYQKGIIIYMVISSNTALLGAKWGMVLELERGTWPKSQSVIEKNHKAAGARFSGSAENHNFAQNNSITECVILLSNFCERRCSSHVTLSYLIILMSWATWKR